MQIGGRAKMPKVVGYARVSTDGQNGDGQIENLRTSSADPVYFEKESGTRTDRPQLAKAIASLKAGDTLLVPAIDRLARSTRDLLNVIHEVGKRGAIFKSQAESWVDTSSPLGEFMLTVLGGVATLERHMIKRRTDEGRRRAKAAGIMFGRKPKLSAFQRKEALARLEAGEPQSAIARTYGVDQSTISRLRALSN
jgi:DNA invertase Pin-like site-specific DNA recombinase